MTASPAPADDGTWSGERVARWLRQAAGLERQLAPVSAVLFAAAALRPGERVLDVGCGTGPTTRQAARAVAPGGHATGLDVAPGMVDAARTASTPDDGDLRWIVADVGGWEPGAERFDVVLSRFGVMFFADPATAFAVLARATAPGGRLAIAVWARRDLSDLFDVPLAAATAAMEADGSAVEPLPLDDGPFSLSDQKRVTALLEATGWTGVGWQTHALRLPFGGGRPPAEAAVAALDFGPTRIVTADLDDDQRARAGDAIAAAFADHVDAEGHVVLGGAVIVVTARRV